MPSMDADEEITLANLWAYIKEEFGKASEIRKKCESYMEKQESIEKKVNDEKLDSEVSD